MSELFIRAVFYFIIGNSDMHLKNFSLIEEEPSSRWFVLSEAYDMLSVNVIIPTDEEQLALTLNGKKRNLRKKDFIIFAEQCNMNSKTALNIINKICSLEDMFLKMCEDSYLSDEQKEALSTLIKERIKVLV